MDKIVRERPILFSAEMVRAILAGWKTQTRRVITNWTFDGETTADGVTTGGYEPGRCPYGVPGDRLWVRETWAVGRTWDQSRPSEMPLADSDRVPTWWRADGVSEESWVNRGRWRPSLHMPRWASRITLEVTSVRVERLQGITEEDAWAEGIEQLDGAFDNATLCRRAVAMGEPVESARVTFAELWDSINGKRPGCSWADNPWAWVVGFRRVT